MPTKPSCPRSLPPAKSKGTQWVRENRAAVEAWNKHVEETG